MEVPAFHLFCRIKQPISIWAGNPVFDALLLWQQVVVSGDGGNTSHIFIVLHFFFNRLDGRAVHFVAVVQHVATGYILASGLPSSIIYT